MIIMTLLSDEFVRETSIHSEVSQKNISLTPVIIALCIHWNDRLTDFSDHYKHIKHSCVCPGSDGGLWLRFGGNVAASLSLWEPWH